MYRLMRNVHLILGLAFVLALGVYLLSSVRLAHRGWFAGGPTVTEHVFPVKPGDASAGFSVDTPQSSRSCASRRRAPCRWNR